MQIAIQFFAVVAGKPQFQRGVDRRQLRMPSRHEGVDVGVGLQIDHDPIHLRRLPGHGKLLQRLDRQIQRLNPRSQNLRLLNNPHHGQFQFLTRPRQEKCIADFYAELFRRHLIDHRNIRVRRVEPLARLDRQIIDPIILRQTNPNQLRLPSLDRLTLGIHQPALELQPPRHQFHIRIMLKLIDQRLGKPRMRIPLPGNQRVRRPHKPAEESIRRRFDGGIAAGDADDQTDRKCDRGCCQRNADFVSREIGGGQLADNHAVGGIVAGFKGRWGFMERR